MVIARAISPATIMGHWLTKNAGHGREIAGAVVAHIEPAPYLILWAVETVEVAHQASLAIGADAATI